MVYLSNVDDSLIIAMVQVFLDLGAQGYLGY